MPGNLTLDALRQAVDSGEIDTVLVCQTDMQGRLMGKRFHARFFVDGGHEETHSCNYLFATDLEMGTVQGYAATSWQAGYGDYAMMPDLSTLRRIPWLEKTALVLCDTADHHHHAIAHAPRALLKGQVDRLAAMGFKSMAATELEFFLFAQSYQQAQAQGWHRLDTLGRYNADYAIFLTTQEEPVMRAIRNGLFGAGIPVEGTKGEAEAGQEEINIRYSDALDTADNHVIAKNGCKEIAFAHGHAATFMAKWKTEAAGSSSHIHQSLWTLDGKPAFYDPDAPHGMSVLLRQYLAGLLKYSNDTTYFLAPYINSYKRFAKGLFAPTKVVWSRDNRTAGYRLCGEGGKGIRVECRIGGADLNPYLGLAAQIAAGLKGIEEGLELGAEFSGDAYETAAPRVPETLRAATAALDGSAMLREAFGDSVIDHYVRAARWEQEEYDRKVNDFDLSRGFERA